MAYVISDACVSCGSCADACPHGCHFPGRFSVMSSTPTLASIAVPAPIPAPTRSHLPGLIRTIAYNATKQQRAVGRRCFFRSRGYPLPGGKGLGRGLTGPPIKVATRPMRQDVKMGGNNGEDKHRSITHPGRSLAIASSLSTVPLQGSESRPPEPNTGDSVDRFRVQIQDVEETVAQGIQRDTQSAAGGAELLRRPNSTAMMTWK